MNAAEEEIVSLIKDTIDLGPLPDNQRTSPIDYFRPREGLNGTARLKIIDIHVMESDIHGDSGTMKLHMVKENYYSDGTTQKHNDWADISVERQDGRWVITDVRVAV